MTMSTPANTNWGTYARAGGRAFAGACVGCGIYCGLGQLASKFDVKVDLKAEDVGYKAAKYAVDHGMSLADLKLGQPSTSAALTQNTVYDPTAREIGLIRAPITISTSMWLWI